MQLIWAILKELRSFILKRLIRNIKLRAGLADCSDYLEIIQAIVDNEISPEDEVHLRRHLKMCLKCLDQLNLDRELKKSLQEKLQNREVPSDLADSILEEISKSA